MKSYWLCLISIISMNFHVLYRSHSEVMQEEILAFATVH